jgi:hypothetical protein
LVPPNSKASQTTIVQSRQGIMLEQFATRSRYRQPLTAMRDHPYGLPP